MKKDLVLDDLERVKREIDGKTEAQIEREHEKSEKSKKFITIFVSVFLVGLILSYLYLSAPVYSYIYGLSGSSKLVNNELIFKNNLTVFFDDEILLFLQDLYDPFGSERALCLLGEINNNEYEVSAYYEPEIFDSGWNFVTHSPCSSETIIMLHTHPFKRCAPSETDKNTLRRTKQSNPEVILMVMCGQQRFSAVIN